MSTGYIRDFSKPAPTPLEQQKHMEIQRLSAATGVQNVEVRVHEEIIVEGDDKIRKTVKKEGDPEVRLRIADLKAWNKIKQGDDD
jgi:hypothetical protein